MDFTAFTASGLDLRLSLAFGLTLAALKVISPNRNQKSRAIKQKKCLSIFVYL